MVVHLLGPTQIQNILCLLHLLLVLFPLGSRSWLRRLFQGWWLSSLGLGSSIGRGHSHLTGFQRLQYFRVDRFVVQSDARINFIQRALDFLRTSRVDDWVGYQTGGFRCSQGDAEAGGYVEAATIEQISRIVGDHHRGGRRLRVLWRCGTDCWVVGGLRGRTASVYVRYVSDGVEVLQRLNIRTRLLETMRGVYWYSKVDHFKGLTLAGLGGGFA